MKLEDIGFYTLNDSRAMNASEKTPLQRCELLITSKCNFKCPYCRGTNSDADISFEHAKNVVDLWADEGLVNIRFSGGEPTTVKWLPELISYTSNKKTIKRIAISTNGSASTDYYIDLWKRGVNDFSISLDACCSAFGDKMTGINGVWKTIVDNIETLSGLTYVTTGCVFDEKNIDQSVETIELASNLGVSDIRILTAAQYNKSLSFIKKIPGHIVKQNQILEYRVNNFKNGRNVRGIQKTDTNKCPLSLDDIAVKGKYHYPCIIHMREKGHHIGVVSKNMRQERLEWFKSHDSKKDAICKNNCLDVCIDYNNRFLELNNGGVV